MTHIHRYRLRPAEMHSKQQDQAYQIDMLYGIKRQAAGTAGRIVTHPQGSNAVTKFMQHNTHKAGSRAEYHFDQLSPLKLGKPLGKRFHYIRSFRDFSVLYHPFPSHASA